jgi:hypothetical protein
MTRHCFSIVTQAATNGNCPHAGSCFMIFHKSDQQGVGLQVCPINFLNIAFGFSVKFFEPSIRISLMGIGFCQSFGGEFRIVHSPFLIVSNEYKNVT